MEEEQLRGSLETGYKIMCSDRTMVSASDVESLTIFKDILKSILEGRLLLATPDRVLPEGATQDMVKMPEPEDSDTGVK